MLVAVVNGKVLKEGDKVRTFRGYEVTFIMVTMGRKVYVKDGEFNREYFPSVIGAEIVDEQDLRA